MLKFGRLLRDKNEGMYRWARREGTLLWPRLASRRLENNCDGKKKNEKMKSSGSRGDPWVTHVWLSHDSPMDHLYRSSIDLQSAGPRFAHGSPTGRSWIVHGPPMDHPHGCTVKDDGPPMGCPWAMGSQQLTAVSAGSWVTHGSPMGYPWVIHGSPVGTYS